MIKACIFDLDGTLLDTINTISHYVNLTLNKFGYASVSAERCKYLAGNGAKILIERAIAEVNGDMKLFDEMFEFYNYEYNKNTTYLTSPFEGIPELLNSMRSMGIKTAVLSNKPDFATKSVVKSFFGENIDVVRGAVDGVKLKPSCEATDIILRELGARKDECLFVGDTAVDMETGKNSGLFTIGVLWGFRQKEELELSGANVIVQKPTEIFTFISGQNK